MSGEGVKFDMGKPPLSLLPRAALEAEAMVLAYGANKYGRDNWRLGMDHSRLLDACLRHIVAYAEGEDIDPESGLPHLAHARCSLGFLLHYRAAGVGADDRVVRAAEPTTAQKPALKEPKVKKVKMLCWLAEGHHLEWLLDGEEGYAEQAGWIRTPAQDIEIEVPDDN